MLTKKVNKAILNNAVLIDLTEDTVSADAVKTSWTYEIS